MDDAFHRSNTTKPGQWKRLFPGYTLAQLEESLPKYTDAPDGSHRAETREKLKSEIAARKDGRSVVRKTPQVGW